MLPAERQPSEPDSPCEYENIADLTKEYSGQNDFAQDQNCAEGEAYAGQRKEGVRGASDRAKRAMPTKKASTPGASAANSLIVLVGFWIPPAVATRRRGRRPTRQTQQAPQC